MAAATAAAAAATVAAAAAATAVAAAAAAAAKTSARRRHRKKNQDFYENLENEKLAKNIEKIDEIDKNIDFGGASQKWTSPPNSTRKTTHIDLFSSPYD